MTIFSLGSACDLEHFSSNTKLDSQENFESPNFYSPVVPMPTDPPFNNTNYTWPSESAAVRDMTTRSTHSNTFQPTVGQDSQGYGNINFGPDQWGGNRDEYSFKNKLLNNSATNNMVGPGMKPQGTYMPPTRSHIVSNEDMNGRDKRVKVKKEVPKVVVQEELVVYPEYDSDKVEKDTKNLWFFLIIILIIVIGSVLYKAKYF